MDGWTGLDCSTSASQTVLSASSAPEDFDVIANMLQTAEGEGGNTVLVENSKAKASHSMAHLWD